MTRIVMRSSRRAVVGVVVGMLASASGVRADVFQITIENVSSNVLTPVPFISHNGAFDLFDAGAAASPALELLAEDGMPTGVVDMANLALLAGDVAGVAVAFGPGMPPVLPPGTSVTVTLEADPAHPWLSFASMLAISNDAFIGVATGDGAINLYPDGVPLQADFTLSFLDVWDAGTEMNDELAVNVPALGAAMDAGVDENGVITRPHPGIAGIGDIAAGAEWYGGDIARITIVPEPATIALLGMGGFLFRRRRSRIACR